MKSTTMVLLLSSIHFPKQPTQNVIIEYHKFEVVELMMMIIKVKKNRTAFNVHKNGRAEQIEGGCNCIVVLIGGSIGVGG